MFRSSLRAFALPLSMLACALATSLVSCSNVPERSEPPTKAVAAEPAPIVEAPAAPPAPRYLTNDELVAKVLAFQPANPAATSLTSEEIDRALVLLGSGYVQPEVEIEFKRNLGSAKTYDENERRNAVTRAIVAQMLVAEASIVEKEASFVAALKSSRREDIAAMIDVAEYKRNLEGTGWIQAKGEKHPAPSNHYFQEEVFIDSAGTKQFRLVETGPMSDSELVTTGVGHILEAYGATDTESTAMRTKSGKLAIFGVPEVPGVDKGIVTEWYCGQFTYTRKGGPEDPLKVMFGGKWGQPAKILFIQDGSLEWHTKNQKDKALAAGRLD